MKWTKPNGQWLHHGTPCKPMGGDYEEIIEAQAQTIRALSVERDGWVEKYRKLEAAHEQVRIQPGFTGWAGEDELENYARGLQA